ncbi:unnamed protein product [Closterium sp. NIES-54]
MDPRYAEKTWGILEDAIHQIYNHNASGLSFEELYRYALRPSRGAALSFLRSLVPPLFPPCRAAFWRAPFTAFTTTTPPGSASKSSTGTCFLPPCLALFRGTVSLHPSIGTYGLSFQELYRCALRPSGGASSPPVLPPSACGILEDAIRRSTATTHPASASKSSTPR